MTGPGRGDEAGFVLPAALAARPRDPRRDVPIPPVNLHPDEATGEVTVDFTNLKKTVSADLAAERRCSLCGAEMGYWVAFLGAPRAAELMRYSDPPGCPDCLRAAVRLCPYIAIERHRRARADRPGAGMMPPGSSGEKADRWVLGVTRRYRSVFIPEFQFTVYLPAPFRRVETYAYGADGRINSVPTIR